MARTFITTLVGAGACLASTIDVSAQTLERFYLNVNVGATIEPAGYSQTPDYLGSLNGSAAIFTIGGGISLRHNLVIDGEASLARSFSAPQSVRLGLIDFATAVATHRDHLITAAVLKRMKLLSAGGGIVFARSITEWTGTATYQNVPPTRQAPYFYEMSAWKTGITGVVSVRAPVATSFGVLASMRVFLFDHDPGHTGLADSLIYRPAVGVDFRF